MMEGFDTYNCDNGQQRLLHMSRVLEELFEDVDYE